MFQQDRDKVYEIKEKKNKRSLNANAYAWVLITQIAEKVNSSKEEVYLDMLRNYGQVLLVPLTPGMNPSGYFKYYDFFEKGKINGKECDWYKVYKGSSEYDTKEMSVLIEGIVYEAKQLDIETLEDYKLDKLVEEWK